MTEATTHYNERDLVAAIKKGQYKAYECVFKKYYPMLCAYAHRFVDMEDVEDIVEECMVWFWEKRESIDITTTLSQYLFSAVRHKALNVLTRKNIADRAAAWYFAVLQEKSLENINHYEADELKRKIQEGIDNLPESYRSAFVMHRFQGMSYKEIANEYNVSTKTVDYRIQQALKILRKQLSDYLPIEIVALIMKFMCDLS